MSEIVVGFDASPTSHRVLAWAAQQARITAIPLRAVHAIAQDPTILASIAIRSIPGPVESVEQLQHLYRYAVSTVWETTQPQADWRLEFYTADPGPTLVAQSIGADMLVIGTRERVASGHVQAGSVSRYCLSHATCPVVAVSPTSVSIPKAKSNWSAGLLARQLVAPGRR